MQELYTYFSVLIHIGITIESAIKDYWGDLELAGISYIIKNYISLMRFQQLNYYLRCTDLWLKENSTLYTIFNRVNDLSEYL